MLKNLNPKDFNKAVITKLIIIKSNLELQGKKLLKFDKIILRKKLKPFKGMKSV